VKLPSGAQLTIDYVTVPANEAHTKNAPGSLAAGDYTIGVIKKGESDWQMALYPGSLDSLFEADRSTAEHVLLDVMPGHGRFESKAVLTMHFGFLFVSGLLPGDRGLSPRRPGTGLGRVRLRFDALVGFRGERPAAGSRARLG
jgi:hypothetical protein